MHETPELDVDALLSPAKAAAIIGVSPRTIDRYILQGRLSPVGRIPGGHRRFRRADVEALLVERAEAAS